jgi:hypothetical protein
LDKPQTSLAGVLMTRGGLHLNAGNYTLPANSLIAFDGSNEQWFALNATSQEIAGLANPAGTENQQRVINDSATDGLLVINVPAETNYTFSARVGYGGSGTYPSQNNLDMSRAMVAARHQPAGGHLDVRRPQTAIENQGRLRLRDRRESAHHLEMDGR